MKVEGLRVVLLLCTYLVISRLWYGLLLYSCDSVYIHGSFKDQLPPYHDRNEEHYGPGSFLFDIRLQARLDRWLSDNEIPYLQD